MVIPDKDIQRFYKYVEKSEGCWNWIGSRQKRARSKYGTFSFKCKQYTTHRFSWLIHEGEIPDGLCVLHECDNPFCVNPEHLWLGTNQDNIDDKVRKGRASGSIKLGQLPTSGKPSRRFAFERFIEANEVPV